MRGRRSPAFALVCGSDYSGALRVYQSRRDAERVLETLTAPPWSLPRAHVRTLLGSAYTSAGVREGLGWLMERLREAAAGGAEPMGIVYVAGHGSRARDTSGEEADGFDEMWVTERGSVRDDDVTASLRTAPPAARILIITDACHSGSAVDMPRLGDADTFPRVVALGAAQDDESALQSGDGSAFTTALLPILRTLTPRDTIEGVFERVTSVMESSWVGTLQVPSLAVSDRSLLGWRPLAPPGCA